MTLTPEQALTIARFCWPGTARPGSEYAKQEDEIALARLHQNPAAAERALVERGLGKAYGGALVHELTGRAQLEGYSGFQEVAAIRTAPPEVIARAILRVVEEQEKP